MASNRYFTPLRYPGGKSKLSWLVKDLITLNGFEGGQYIEPYAGGAGVAMELLLKDVVSHVHINDLNEGVYCFWDSVLNDTESLMGKIYDCCLDMPTWYEQRHVMSNCKEYSRLDVGFAFFFLNRTNRSGIIGAGVIGGYEQKGNYKIDARFNKDELIERITSIAKKRERVSLHNKDAEEFLVDIDAAALPGGFFYVDPPYFVKGKRLYDNFYEGVDHSRISEVVARLRTPWMLSYDDHEEIRRLYSKFRISEIDLVYSAALKTKGQEVVFFSDGLLLPDKLNVA